MDKCPRQYESYQSTLTPALLAKAKEQLHEDECTRDPSLVQMREFIAKHPQIQRCRTDALFLLRFLRARKFNVTAACEMLENYLRCFQQWPHCFRIKDPFETYEKLIDAAYLVPLGYTSGGQFVLLYRPACLDLSWMRPAHVMKLGAVLAECYCDEEELQVGGMELISDYQGVTVANLGMWTIMDLKLLMDATTKAMPIRTKRVHISGLPRFGAALVSTCLAMIPLKNQQKVVFHKTTDELKAAVDNSVLPTIYGGSLSLEEANDRFRKRVAQERDRILLINEFDLDVTMPSPNAKNSHGAGLQSDLADEAVIGSFRKLNVD
uniref:Putative phosphatidylinositol transfer protein sec14 n=1 Tax=Aedes aegypti TaxID=7159 RepID=A0A0P6JS57_AEDAE